MGPCAAVAGEGPKPQVVLLPPWFYRGVGGWGAAAQVFVLPRSCGGVEVMLSAVKTTFARARARNARGCAKLSVLRPKTSQGRVCVCAFFMSTNI